jgi:type VI secretion system protein ImpM
VSTAIVSAQNGPPFVYGKLPARGDFITRGFERRFLDPWDEWLQQAMIASQESLAELWRDAYLTSPIWRFALSAGSCGPDTMLGVLIPSVDKVGRYFPLTLGCALAPGHELTCLIAHASPWYRATEELALAALEPGFSLEALEQPIALDVDGMVMAMPPVEPMAPPGLYLPFGPNEHATALRHAHQPLAQGLSLWWTTGSERVAPCLLISPGMPPASSFTAFLDGDWQGRGWTVPEEEPPPSEMAADVEQREEIESRDSTVVAAEADQRASDHAEQSEAPAQVSSATDDRSRAN